MARFLPWLIELYAEFPLKTVILFGARSSLYMESPKSRKSSSSTALTHAADFLINRKQDFVTNFGAPVMSPDRRVCRVSHDDPGVVFDLFFPSSLVPGIIDSEAWPRVEGLWEYHVCRKTKEICNKEICRKEIETIFLLMPPTLPCPSFL